MIKIAAVTMAILSIATIAHAGGGDLVIGPVSGNTTTVQPGEVYYSDPDDLGMVKAIRGGHTLVIMPKDTDLHHVDMSGETLQLFPGSCIAAPPAKCLLDHSGAVTR